MKLMIIPILSILLTLLGCQDPASKKSSSSSNNSTTIINGDYCTQNPSAYGCSEYCSENPTKCTSSTSDSSSSDSSGATDTSSQYIPKDNNWEALYGEETQENPAEFECSSPTGSGYDLRRGTITLAGDNTWYIPGGDTTYESRTGDSLTSTDFAAFSNNTSSFLITAAEAKNFYDTDAKLKVRFKIRPQPKPTKGETWCYNRQTGQSQDTWGYTLLKFNVSVVGLNKNGSLKKSGVYPILESTKSVTANVGACSTSIDFSGDNQRHPYGMVLVVHDVQSDQSCWYNTDSSKCTGYKTLRRASCWMMDIEASVDGTKDI